MARTGLPQQAHESLVHVKTTDGSGTTPGLLIKGSRPFVLAPTQRILARDPRKPQRLELGTALDVIHPEGSRVTGQVVRSSDRSRPWTALRVPPTTLGGSNLVACPVEQGSRLFVFDGDDWREFTAVTPLHVDAARSWQARITIRRLSTAAFADYVGSPVWSEQGLVGQVTRKSKEGLYSVATVNSLRSALPVADTSAGSSAYTVQREFNSVWLELYNALSLVESTGIDDELCSAITGIHKALSSAAEAYVERDELGASLYGLSQELLQGYQEWNRFASGPQGERQRQSKLRELRRIKGHFFSEAPHLDVAVFDSQLVPSLIQLCDQLERLASTAGAADSLFETLSAKASKFKNGHYSE